MLKGTRGKIRVSVECGRVGIEGGYFTFSLMCFLFYVWFVSLKTTSIFCSLKKAGRLFVVKALSMIF